MVQVSFDTNNDSLQELEEALKMLQAAVERRGAHAAAKLDIAQAGPASAAEDDAAVAGEPAEDAAIDTPFLKITVKSDERKVHKKEALAPDGSKVPTLNQLIHDASLTEDELTRMFGEQGTDAIKAKQRKNAPESIGIKDEKEDAYIEIIEYTDEKK